MEYSAIVVAAGSGSRSGLDFNKVFYKMGDKTVIENSIKNFVDDPECKEIIIVVGSDELQTFKDLKLSNKVKFTFGGKERKDSVYAGLKEVEYEYVMVHDGARPYLERKSIEELKEALRIHDAALLMVPTIDTSKKVKDGYVVKTLDRSELYNAQTPQVFKTSLLKEAYTKLIEDDGVVTDDVQVVEMYSNIKVKVVLGDYKNIKITTVEDIKRI